jgi:hypothetical protein
MASKNVSLLGTLFVLATTVGATQIVSTEHIFYQFIIRSSPITRTFLTIVDWI